MNLPKSSRRVAVVLALLATAHLFAQPELPNPALNAGERDDTVPADNLLAMSFEELMEMEIEVASLFKENSLKVGSSVEAVTSQDWERLGARRTEDAISHLPSVMVLPTLSGSNAIAIRGYATELSVRGVATILDGVPLNTVSGATAQYAVPNFGLQTLDRIEMIRGPGSSLYGSDAFHGVYSLKSFTADENMLNVGAEVGSNSFSQVGFRISQEVSDSLRLNSAFSLNGTNDQNWEYDYTNPTTGAEGTGERKNKYVSGTGIIKLQSDKTKERSYRLGLYRSDFDSDQYPGAARHLRGQSFQLNRDWTVDGNAEFTMINGAVVQKLPNDIEMELNGYAWEQEMEFGVDLTLTPGGGPFGNVLTQGQTDYRRGASIIFKQPANSWNTQWVTSCSYSKMKVDSTANIITSPGGVVLSNTQAAYEGFERTIYSFFIQAKTSFFDDHLYFIYGGRYDDYSDFGQQLTPRAGVIYQPTETSALKFLYGNSFRAAAASEIGGTAVSGSGTTLEPEELDTYEVIYMHQSEKWKGEVTYFQNKWSDGINLFSGSYQNRGKSESQGVELSLKHAGRLVRTNLSASYVDSRNLTDRVDYCAFPSYIVNLGFGYTWERQKIELYLSNRIHIGAKDGPIKATVPNPADLDDYFRTDLHLKKTLSAKSEIWLNIHNIFGHNNYLPAIWSSEGGIPDEGFNVSVGMQCSF